MDEVRDGGRRYGGRRETKNGETNVWMRDWESGLNQ